VFKLQQISTIQTN